MFLIESVIANKRSISVQIGAEKAASFILEKKRLITPIFDREELERQLKIHFGSGDIGKVQWNIDTDSVERSVHLIERYISKRS